MAFIVSIMFVFRLLPTYLCLFLPQPSVLSYVVLSVTVAVSAVTAPAPAPRRIAPGLLLLGPAAVTLPLHLISGCKVASFQVTLPRAANLDCSTAVPGRHQSLPSVV